MRKITLLLVALFAAVGCAFAALPALNDVGYLYNPSTGKFVSQSATVTELGDQFTIADVKACGDSFGSDDASISEAGYTYIRFQVTATGGYMRMTNAGVVCSGSGYHKWAVMETEKGLVIRCIYTSTQSNNALDPAAHQGYYVTPDADGKLTLVETPTEASYWQFMDEAGYQAIAAEIIAAKEAEEAQATKDALAALNGGEGPKAGDELLAALFPNAGFDASNNADGWTVTTKGGNSPSYKVENGNCGMTKYQGTIKMEKTIKGLPAGWYTLKAQAFARKGNNASNIEKYNAGEELEVSAFIFANDVQKQAKNILEGAIAEKGAGTYSDFVVGGETKYVLNNSNSGSYVFSLGEYAVELIVYVAEGEALTFGYNKPTDDTDDYCGCDNFQLIYEGTAMPQTFADGKYYLYNVEAKRFWGASNNWGTKASLVEHPEYITLHYKENGYQIETLVNNGGTQYYFNGDFMDNGSPKSLFIVPFGKYYKIYASDAVYGYDGTSTVLGTKAEGDAAAWQIITEDDMKAQLAKATAKEPVDATFLILNPNFGRNNRWGGSLSTKNDQVKNADLGSAWSFEAGNKDVNGDVTNYCVESYHSVFSLSQTISGAPKGTYALTAQGFYRQDGSDNDNLPVFFANDKNAIFPLKTGTENSMSDASKSFTNGLYTIEPIIFEVGDDGTITLGAKLENNTSLWCIWDNFVLKYYGPDATELDVKAAQAIEDYQKALADAKKVDQTKIEVEAVKTALADALAAYPEETVLAEGATKESIEAATAALAAATDAAEASVIAANILPKMLAFTETTNVYTQEAFDAYYTQYYDKYVAGTLTAEEARGLQDPYAETGWRAAITVDNFLLSAWDTNPDFNNAPYYINSWSVEGDNDGTGFRVPFFEYFAQETNSLGEKTLTATMTGLEPGSYSVSAWVRVRVKNETAAADATGVTFQVNDGEEVDVTEGEAVDRFNLAQYTVKGDVTDGTLKIKFNVAADNNIHWLSFKNVKFEKVGDATKIAGVSEKASQNAIFNVAGQQVKSLQKGLNIVDGKKVLVK